MLDCVDEKMVTPRCTQCGQNLDQVQCRVQIPEQWLSALKKQGSLPAVSKDARRFSRFHYYSQAILYCDQSLPGLERPHDHFVVLTKNLSRTGMCFLHESQLYPGEKMRIRLTGDRQVDFEVCRCLVVNDSCYDIGVQFTSPVKY